MSKYIFIMGGVCSSLGKGIASATIGLLLKRMGYSVIPLKLDPYLNVDPGTMSPERHGEVFVTDDGSETDLDLGHYERFLDQALGRASSLTMGQVYQRVLSDERQGVYLGRDIQIIPHVTNRIKAHIRDLAKDSKADFVLVEIGGTIGDVEGFACMEAVRQLIHEEGRENAISVVLTLLPYLKSSRELKTKPTQLAIHELQRMGIQPDMILCRSDYPMSPDHFDKISLFCNVTRDAVLPAYTLDTIYAIPRAFKNHNVHNIVLEKLGIKSKKEPDIRDFEELEKTIENTALPTMTIAVVKKYNELDDAYISVHEAIKAGVFSLKHQPNIVAIDSEELEKDNTPAWEALKQADGILIPGGFGSRGIEGKIRAATYARENNIPYFGLCLGSQILAIEYGRHVAGLTNAHSVEFSEDTPHPIVHLMDEQENIQEKGGTMRKGSYPCAISKGTKAYEAYHATKVDERHRHRFEFNNMFRDTLTDKGIVFSGRFEEKNIVEIVEIKDHPFMVGVQFHPEFKSRPTKPHPLFLAFAKAIKKHISQ